MPRETYCEPGRNPELKLSKQFLKQLIMCMRKKVPANGDVSSETQNKVKTTVTLWQIQLAQRLKEKNTPARANKYQKKKKT